MSQNRRCDRADGMLGSIGKDRRVDRAAPGRQDDSDAPAAIGAGLMPRVDLGGRAQTGAIRFVRVSWLDAESSQTALQSGIRNRQCRKQTVIARNAGKPPKGLACRAFPESPGARSMIID